MSVETYGVTGRGPADPFGSAGAPAAVSRVTRLVVTALCDALPKIYRLLDAALEDVVPVRTRRTDVRCEQVRGRADGTAVVGGPGRDRGGDGQDDGREAATPDSAHGFTFRGWLQNMDGKWIAPQFPPPAVRRDRGLAGPRAGASRALRAVRSAGFPAGYRRHLALRPRRSYARSLASTFMSIRQ